MFHQQPATLRQKRRRMSHQDCKSRQTIGMIRQGIRRLEPQISLTQMIIPGMDIRRIGYNHIKYALH